MRHILIFELVRRYLRKVARFIRAAMLKIARMVLPIAQNVQQYLRLYLAEI